MKIRTVFMGSPEFALPTLRILAERMPVVGVVTQPDRPAGRGRILTPPPVKVLAEELGLPLIQPRRLREAEATQQLLDWKPELIIVAAFGQILRDEILELPTYGCVNLHASLLPRWRGAAPIHAAILYGDTQSGVTIMRMDAGIDTGPILSQKAVPILPDDTTASLGERLGQLGAELLAQTLPDYLAGKIKPMAQEEYTGQEPTYAPMLKKEDGLLDFTQGAEDLERRVRAFTPWPGAYTFWQGQNLKIIKAHAVNPPPPFSGDFNVPGKPVVYQGLPAIITSKGIFVIDELQPAGKKPMAGKVFLLGAYGWEE
jgi:methionyl-tRNA formyltransferase